VLLSTETCLVSMNNFVSLLGREGPGINLVTLWNQTIDLRAWNKSHRTGKRTYTGNKDASTLVVIAGTPYILSFNDDGTTSCHIQDRVKQKLIMKWNMADGFTYCMY